MKNKINDAINAATSEHEFSDVNKKRISIVLLLFSSYLTSLNYTGKVFIFTVDRSISPDFISGIIGLCLLLPMYGRGIMKWSFSIYSTIIFVLFLIVYSAIVKLALLGNGNIPVYLITGAVVVGWLGLRALAGFAWILAFAAAVTSALSGSAAMGFSGFLFVVSSFLGLIMHSNIAPHKLMSELQKEYSGFGRKTSEIASQDIEAAKDRLHY